MTSMPGKLRKSASRAHSVTLGCKQQRHWTGNTKMVVCEESEIGTELSEPHDDMVLSSTTTAQRGRNCSDLCVSTATQESTPFAATSQRRTVYTIAALFTAIVSYVTQAQLAISIQQDLSWRKPCLILYVTRGSSTLLWPTGYLLLFIRNRQNSSFVTTFKRHQIILHEMSRRIQRNSVYQRSTPSPQLPSTYVLKTAIMINGCFTAAGICWFVATAFTTLIDISAIYNCSVFFTQTFSMCILRDKFEAQKAVAVGISMFGIILVTYSGSENPTGAFLHENRLIGDAIMLVGACFYGLYEVLYKRFACPPDNCEPAHTMYFSLAFGSLLGFITLTTLWLAILVLHITKVEIFELPSIRVGSLLVLCALANMMLSAAFLFLLALTSPIYGSIVSLLATALITLGTWINTDSIPTSPEILGMALIVIAFAIISMNTILSWRAQEAFRHQLSTDLLRQSLVSQASLGKIGKHHKYGHFTASAASGSIWCDTRRRTIASGKDALCRAFWTCRPRPTRHHGASRPYIR